MRPREDHIASFLLFEGIYRIFIPVKGYIAKEGQTREGI
jgi:hypothetical protein